MSSSQYQKDIVIIIETYIFFVILFLKFYLKKKSFPIDIADDGFMASWRLIVATHHIMHARPIFNSHIYFILTFFPKYFLFLWHIIIKKFLPLKVNKELIYFSLYFHINIHALNRKKKLQVLLCIHSLECRYMLVNDCVEAYEKNIIIFILIQHYKPKDFFTRRLKASINFYNESTKAPAFLSITFN